MSESLQRKTLIYLTGFMGSGKSTIGPILANTLGYEFIDIDKAIEQRLGKSVKEIFRSEGAEFFRTTERDVIEEISKRDHIVVSLGGGSLVDPANFHRVKTSGLLIYLESSPEHLLKRLQHKSDRPVLADSEGDRLEYGALRERVMNLYREREPIYAQADLRIHTDQKKVGLTVDEIVKRLTRHGR